VLQGAVAVVAGASRGCGRGIALALGDTGATVYVTGRTVRGGPAPPDGAPGTIEDTAEEVTRRGGRGIAVRTDHTRPDEVEALFARVRSERGRLDVLACAVWGGNERYMDPAWKRPLWQQPAEAWHESLNAGPGAFWLTARAASGLMAANQGERASLIVTITEPVLPGGPEALEEQSAGLAQTFWNLGHHAMNRLVVDLAGETRAAGIAIVGVMPGFMKTERVERHLEELGDEVRQQYRYDLAETTEYAGRAVVALAGDPDVQAKSGALVYVADLAEEYGFTDVDGRRVGNFYRALGMIP
jgi:NAD(P)-dependent dehydrogenase (short-subunit alcohol dehydrogenase family)